MGVSMQYNIPGALRLDTVQAWKREKQLELDEMTTRIAETRELIDAGIVPSDSEADDFYAALGADVEALSLLDLKRLDELGALMPKAMLHYERDYSWDWLDKLTPELRRQVEIELGVSVVSAWQEAKRNSNASPQWPLYAVTPPPHISVASQEATQPLVNVGDRYGVGTVIAGEVLPMRAEAGSPDTLDLSRDAISRVIDDPWAVVPPEQWTHRFGEPNFRTRPEAEQLEAARAYLMQVTDSDEEEPEESDF